MDLINVVLYLNPVAFSTKEISTLALVSKEIIARSVLNSCVYLKAIILKDNPSTPRWDQLVLPAADFQSYYADREKGFADLNCARISLALGIDPSGHDNLPIRWAANYNFVAVVELLINDPRVDPAARDNDALKWAVRNNNTEVIKLLLQCPRVLASTRHDLI